MSMPIVYPVQIDAKSFRRFALYDAFLLRRRALRPLLFFAILLCFSIVCFCQTDKEQAALLGGVLLGVAILLPLAYVVSFLLQVNAQVKRRGLTKPRSVYTLTMSDSEIVVVNNVKEETHVHLPWKTLTGVWRGHGAFYLYATSARAFILPDGQISLSPAEFEAFLRAHLPEGKLHGHVRKSRSKGKAK